MKKLIILLFPYIAFTQIDNIKLQQDFVKELNIYRTSKGLNSVILDSSATQSAKKQTDYCISINTLTHDYPDFKSHMAECGWFSINSITAKQCLNSWIDSSSHNKLLLLDDITTIGIYCAKGMYLTHEGYYVFLVLNP